MSDIRINTGITILPDLKRALSEQAATEDKTVSRLLEVLARWALDEMKRNHISSTTLKAWRAVPPRGRHPAP